MSSNRIDLHDLAPHAPRPRQTVTITVSLFEASLLIEAIESRARFAAANLATIAVAASWFDRVDQLRESVR